MPEQTLAQKWRAKYGAAYDDLSDAELEAKIDAKYPGDYDDIPRTPSGVTDPKTGITYPIGATEPIPSRSLTKRAVVTRIGQETAANQAESDRLASEHPVLTTAALMATAAGPGVLRAATMRAAPMATRAVAAGKAVVKGALPIVKYEVVKNALEGVGVPSAAAAAAAALVSVQGMKEPSAATTAAPGATSAPKPSVATAEPVAAPEPARPVASPQALRNEAGLAVRRAAKQANATFTPKQFEAASALVDQGMAPAKAVMTVKNAGRDVSAAAKLAALLGTPTVERMEADVAARVATAKARSAARPSRARRP